MKGLKKIIQSDAAYEILDNSNCPGTTWMEGGCAILARALNMYAGYPMYVIFNKEYDSPEHFGVKTPSGSIIDGMKEYKDEFTWIQDFKENEFPRAGELVVIPYTEGMGLGGVEFDEEASAKLAGLIKNYSSIRKEVRNVLRETMIQEFLTQDEVALRQYLSMSDEKKKSYLPHEFSYFFNDFLEEEGIEFVPPKHVVPSNYADEPDVEENMFEEDYELVSWLENNNKELYNAFAEYLFKKINDNTLPVPESEYPAWSYFDSSPELVKNQWLIHFTNNADDIAREGFKYGVDDMTKLGLTTSLGEFEKKYGGYNFAYTLSDFPRYSTRDYTRGGGYKYGKEAVVFNASGIKLWHHGDQEPQVIFYGKTATNIIPITSGENADWAIHDKNGRVLFENDELKRVVQWLVSNYAQYRKSLNESAANISEIRKVVRKALYEMNYEDDVEDYISKQKFTVDYVSTSLLKPIISFDDDYYYDRFKEGIHKPILVTKKTMHIVDGNHRWKYAKDNHIDKVPVIFIDEIPMHIRKKVINKLSSMIDSKVKLNEASMGPGGKLIDFDFKFIYPYDEIWELIRHYVRDNEKTWRQFGWTIFDSDYPSDKYKSDRFTFFRVEKIDDFSGGLDEPILDILDSDEEAYERAEKAGFILDEDGIVLGLNGINLVDQANN